MSTYKLTKKNLSISYIFIYWISIQSYVSDNLETTNPFLKIPGTYERGKDKLGKVDQVRVYESRTYSFQYTPGAKLGGGCTSTYVV